MYNVVDLHFNVVYCMAKEYDEGKVWSKTYQIGLSLCTNNC